jgi:hypothetical protein
MVDLASWVRLGGWTKEFPWSVSQEFQGGEGLFLYLAIYKDIFKVEFTSASYYEVCMLLYYY